MTQTPIRIATFNVSMDASNYLPEGTKPSANSADVLLDQLQRGDNAQISNIAAIIQTVRPDIVLLNEFDYTANPEHSVKWFQDNYLARPQQGAEAIEYPYFYSASVNTGVAFPFDLNGDGKVSTPADTYGFGYYPGQYGMLLLSRYPIDTAAVRSFQRFKWKDLPGALEPRNLEGSPYYSPEAWDEFRLSSKSHWDIPVKIEDKTLHLLASHPTPPVFDGPEDRNGKRNHDEVRLWVDYISAEANYLYDDSGATGGLSPDSSFVIVGDLNASPHEGDGHKDAIKALLHHPRVTDPNPGSAGGVEARSDNPHSRHHTAVWGMRADYVLPSSDLVVAESGVFWPAQNEPKAALVADRRTSSDHLLVWVDVIF
ncbi:endonuclease/exonuclease/phosphatase family protein [Gilvimarinus xylanilyticus]|uniref:Endonuclease/exonuclease/phosphatase family protein n=1 Tax=Gilvimarinus xylanilyticus TaxID=2944139 RepID=A0A9X2I5G0_9GAMM|nr:endonuclease/exonuclease/phosphatase family protein [Gilvimarinus xylanilyticus]MCP8899252.1 endonuclease/exonuclease/phosphatase family protein [Gilvimarinus xylanilyticus]